MEGTNVEPGNILRHKETGELNYVFEGDEDSELGVNACKLEDVASGIKEYGEELYPLSLEYLEDYEVVGKYGSGHYHQGSTWWKMTNPKPKK